MKAGGQFHLAIHMYIALILKDFSREYLFNAMRAAQGLSPA